MVVYGDFTNASEEVLPTQVIDISTIAGSSFAESLDLNGDWFGDLAIASPTDKQTYLYLGTSRGYSTKPIVINPPSDILRFSTSLSTGDFNGDGYSDLAIGGFDPKDGEQVFVYPGGPSGLSTVPAQILHPATFSTSSLEHR